MSQNDNDILTREETMKLLSISNVTLWKWTKKGTLKSYGLGKRIYYKKSEIEKALVPIGH